MANKKTVKKIAKQRAAKAAKAGAGKKCPCNSSAQKGCNRPECDA